MFALAGKIKSQGYAVSKWYRFVLQALRFLSLFLFALLVGRPQQVDRASTIEVEGIDIMLVLDVSDSMNLIDDLKDKRTRVEVEREEAIRFVRKRDNDQIGLVFFADDAIARLPLTVDKEPIIDVLNELDTNVLDPNGTHLMKGLLTAVNRLKHSKAKSKIIILLTDGTPTGGDFNPEIVMDIVKKIDVKIYTIGVGQSGGYYPYGNQYIHFNTPVNEVLLKNIARMTGGKYFAAHNPQDMRKIYETIDKLERDKIETPLYSNYYELGIPLLIAVFVLMLLEMFLRFFVWKTL